MFHGDFVPNPTLCFSSANCTEVSLKYGIQERVTSKPPKFLIKLITHFYQEVLECFASQLIWILEQFSVLLSIVYLKM